MTYWKSSEFKELQQAWYQKLAEHGFDDVETMVGDELLLRQHAAEAYRSLRLIKRKIYRSDEGDIVRIARTELNWTARHAKEDYFRIISSMAQTSEFKNEVDRIVIVRFAEGKKACEICEELKQRGTPRYRHAIRFIVRRYEMQWGLKKYTPRQLGKKAG